MPRTAVTSVAVVTACSAALLAQVSAVAVAQSASETRQPELVPILENLPVSSAQKLVHQTPVATFNGAVYLTVIKPGKDGDNEGTSLRTVLHKGVPSTSKPGKWDWGTHIIDENTAHDAWHTPPSVGVDDMGYIHVAYNMHNLPWQYKVSTLPEDISNFKFRGQKLSDKQLHDYFELNKTTFPSAGRAAIPGNQITYPAFYNDRENNLYITYRFAAKPKRSFSRRAMSAGVAQYNSANKTWSSLGGSTNTIRDEDYTYVKQSRKQRVAGMQEGWNAYFPRLAFDSDNKPLVQMFWREGSAGPNLSKPCFATLNNSKSFPLTANKCGNMGFDANAEFNGSGNVASDSDGQFYAVLSPTEGTRLLATMKDGQWQHEELPFSANEIAIDASDNLWAFASGLRVFKRTAGEADWKLVIDSKDRVYCSPRVKLDADRANAYVYARRCTGRDMVGVFKLAL